MHVDVLAQTVKKAWDVIDGKAKFGVVVERWWKRVLNLILLGKGGNELVEQYRGVRTAIDDVVALLVDYGDVDEENLDDAVENMINDDVTEDNEDSDDIIEWINKVTVKKMQNIFFYNQNTYFVPY